MYTFFIVNKNKFAPKIQEIVLLLIVITVYQSITYPDLLSTPVGK